MASGVHASVVMPFACAYTSQLSPLAVHWNSPSIAWPTAEYTCQERSHAWPPCPLPLTRARKMPALNIPASPTRIPPNPSRARSNFQFLRRSTPKFTRLRKPAGATAHSNGCSAAPEWKNPPRAPASGKIKVMVTDPARVRRDDPGNPEVCTAFVFHSIYTPGEEIPAIEKACREAAVGCVQCKKDLSNYMLGQLEPIYAKRQELLKRPDYLKDVLAAGEKKAREAAQATMHEVREAIGI